MISHIRGDAKKNYNRYGDRCQRNGQVFDRKVPTIFRALAEQNYYGGYLGLYHCWPGKEHDGLDNWSWLDYVEDHPYDTYEEKKKSLEAYAKEHGFYQTDQYLKDFKAQAGFTDFPIEHHSMGRITDKAINCTMIHESSVC